MTTLTVSVIIPTYNAAHLLPRSIDSALSQTSPPLEIIVVDDGSTDHTAEVLAEYGSRITHLQQDNAGAATARNTGAALARGDLFAFLDADDRWHPEKLALQVAAFHEQPGLAFCTCNVRSVGSEEIVPDLPMVGTADVHTYDDFKAVFRQPYFGTPTVMMSRDVFEECSGFDETLTTSEDVDLWLRAAFGRTVACVRARLVDVYRMPGSLSSKGTHEGNLLAIDRFCAAHPDFAKEERRLVRSVRAEVYTSWGSEELVQGRRKAAAVALSRGLRQRVTLRGLYLAAKLWLP